MSSAAVIVIAGAAGIAAGFFVRRVLRWGSQGIQRTVYAAVFGVLALAAVFLLVSRLVR